MYGWRIVNPYILECAWHVFAYASGGVSYCVVMGSVRIALVVMQYGVVASLVVMSCVFC